MNNLDWLERFRYDSFVDNIGRIGEEIKIGLIFIAFSIVLSTLIFCYFKYRYDKKSKNENNFKNGVDND
ncbi:hypothetical protein KG089_05575 [Carnobacteriaceae bacterium zg-ZUI252]|nr:hypothetical protein [Carnobacteriaceae bacterium zg-ZUI252]MBS4770678.1 hypothetical protein [Carnobacteriaceae bacterium zg-ZUI240]QTU82933.1 hypothetical protein J7S27_06600 [Carnobacteriaceae bacterium zg-C25]